MEVEPPAGMHAFEVNGATFVVDKRYALIKTVGTGAYGVVVSVKDSVTGRSLAIKKVPNAFDDLTDSKRILREILLLRHLKHENVVGMFDIINPHTTIDGYADVYMVMDLMETDLHRIIYSRQPLTDEHVQFFIFQILRALKYIHSAGVLHRDIKPSNLLIDSTCDLKICDFGLARGVADEDLNLTEYVVTRWYRAPEIMLSCKDYSFSVDVWSTGCIMAELIGRKPLFPGDDYIHQLQLINDAIGSPSEADMEFIQSQKAKRFMRSLPQREHVSFSKLFPTANALAIDLLNRMLVFDPVQRITVDQALAHPYLAAMSSGENDINPMCDRVFDFKYEGIKFDKTMLQELMYEEMCVYHPEARHHVDQRRKDGNMKVDLAYADKQARQHPEAGMKVV
jgi:serine/threonine protein kinase